MAGAPLIVESYEHQMGRVGVGGLAGDGFFRGDIDRDLHGAVVRVGDGRGARDDLSDVEYRESPAFQMAPNFNVPVRTYRMAN